MPTTITKTVKPAGGGDYFSLQAAITGEVTARANLVTRDELLVIECYSGSDTTPATINGFTTDATRYVKVTCPTGHGFDGAWHASRYVLSANEDRPLTLQDENIVIDGLQIETTSTGLSNSDGLFLGSSGLVAPVWTIKNTIVKANWSGTVNDAGFRGSTLNAAGMKVYFINCVAWNCANGDSSVDCFGFNTSTAASSEYYYYNCLAVNCNVGFRDRDSIRIKNCAAIDCLNGYLPTSGPHAASTNNASSLNLDARGLNPKDLVVVSFMDAAAGDFRIADYDVGLRDQGTDLSADAAFPFNYDVVGTVRTAPWCIGPFENNNPSTVQAFLWPWVGAVQPTTARVAVRMNQSAATMYLDVSTSSDLSSPTSFGPVATNSNNVGMFDLTGLTADTEYYYAPRIGATTYTPTCRFRTFPTTGSFSFVHAGDAQSGSSHTVFTNIKELDPQFVIVNGDLHYNDIVTNDITLFRAAYNAVRSSNTQRALAQNVPFDYVWDDHDFGGDQSDATAVAKPAAQLAYRENFPHYTLPAGTTGSYPIYHSFVCGRCRFIVTDFRSERGDRTATDNASKSILGTTQKAWFKAELSAGLAAKQMMFWICGVGWIMSLPADPADSWAGYTTERREISDYIQANGITNLIRLSTDTHFIALDDGTNDHYTTDGLGNELVTFHSAPLDANPANMGGPYSHGTFEERGQYGVITVTDLGGRTVRVTLSGRRNDKEMLRFSKTYTLDSSLPVADEHLSPWTITPPSAGGIRQRAAIKVHRNAALTLTTGKLTPILWDTQDSADDVLNARSGMHSTTSQPSRVVLPERMLGSALINGQVTFSSNDVGRRLVQIKKNGAAVLAQVDSNPMTGVTTSVNVFAIDTSAKPGDYYELIGYQNSGTALALETGAVNTYLSVADL